MEKEILEFYRKTSSFTDLDIIRILQRTCQMMLNNCVYYKECK